MRRHLMCAFGFSESVNRSRMISTIALVVSPLALHTLPGAAQTMGSETQGKTGWLSDYGGFAGLDLRLGQAADQFAAFTGAEAALLIKRRAYVGFRGTGLAMGNIEFPTGQSSVTEQLRMGYGGLMLGYTLPAAPLLDFALDVLMGSGGVRSRNEDG